MEVRCVHCNRSHLIYIYIRSCNINTEIHREREGAAVLSGYHLTHVYNHVYDVCVQDILSLHDQ